VRQTTILREPPDGWWYHDKRSVPSSADGLWVGPFESAEAAEAMVKALVPDHAKKDVRLVKLARGEERGCTDEP